MKTISNYMDEAMREAKEEHLRQHSFDKYYRKLSLNNLINRAEYQEEKGVHMNETVNLLREMASNRDITPESRHRMAKEIAEELLAEKGDNAYFYCVEKLANNTTAPRLWRDVLTYLDEMKGKANESI